MSPNPSTASPAVSETLLQPLRFLLMRYARSPSPAVAGHIADYVEKLLADRNFEVPPQERCTYLQMRTYWRLVERLG